MAGDGTSTRDMIIRENGVHYIATLLDNGKPGTSFTRNASWTLANLCRGRPSPDARVIVRAIPSLANVLIANDSEEIIADICWAFSYLSDTTSGLIPAMLKCGVLPRIISLLHHENIGIQISCLRSVGNILTGNDEVTQEAL